MAKRVPKKRRSTRALHKRIFLHPITLLLLLCVGVLMVGLSIRAYGAGASQEISATIFAPLPTAPATITSPADQIHFSAAVITVAGTCPANSYVDLNDNSSLVGVANCGSGQTTYSLQINLSLGSNVLAAQVYNVTNQAGPAPTSITVWLDNPAPPPTPTPAPPSPPTTLQVTSQDSTSYQSGAVTSVSPYVTERGIAPPFSLIVVTFHSNPLTCQTYADSNGNWSCTLDQALADGFHDVYVTATTPQGQVLTLVTYHIHVSSGIAPLQPPHLAITPFLVTTHYHYQVLNSGQALNLRLGLSGGAGPYAVTILWGDGKESTIARSDTAQFSTMHTYIATDGRQQLYTVKIEVADSTGASAYLQLPELIHGSGNKLAIIGSLGDDDSFIGRWIFLAWPTYLILVLMAVSFWLGERQEDYKIFKRRKLRQRRT